MLPLTSDRTWLEVISKCTNQRALRIWWKKRHSTSSVLLADHEFNMNSNVVLSDVACRGCVEFYNMILIRLGFHTLLYYYFFTWYKGTNGWLKLKSHKGSSWSWLYGSWIYNYLCNQCLPPLKWWVQIPVTACCTRYNFMRYSLQGLWFFWVLRISPPIELTATR